MASSPSPTDLLRKCVAVLDGLGVAYFVTGSVASAFYGDPRFTNDIDLVVWLPLEKVGELAAAFPLPDYYVSEDAMREAVTRRGQFNILHPASGLKIDVIIPVLDAFNAGRLARRRRIPYVTGAEIQFASPEDVILKKMEYFREGGSEKHLRDIMGILRLAHEPIDLSYIEEWVGRLDLAQQWAEVRKRAREHEWH